MNVFLNKKEKKCVHKLRDKFLIYNYFISTKVHIIVIMIIIALMLKIIIIYMYSSINKCICS